MIDDWNTPAPRTDPNAETQTQKCDRLLRTFKWEIGNDRHIHIRDVATMLGRERRYKTVNKKRVDELEKRLISAIEYANKS